MNPELPIEILNRAYQLQPGALDTFAAELGKTGWVDVTTGLTFGGYDSGGGCMMLVADLPGGHRLQLTDGKTDYTQTADRFCLGIVDAEGEELLIVFSPS